VAAGPTSEQRQAAIAAAENELTNAQLALDVLQDNAALRAAQVLQEIAAIDKARDKAQQYLDNLHAGAERVDIDAAWAEVVIAQDKLEQAREDFDPYDKKAEDNLTRAVFQARLAEAQRRYDNLVERYNNLIGTANQYEFALAEADLALVETRLADARRRYEEVKDGPDPDDLAQAQNRLALAQANLALAKADPSPEQLAVALAQVEAAQSALQVIQVQMDKLAIAAASDGVVLSRSVEPGEVINPGAPLLTLAQLSDLTITVYVPEDRYGEVTLAQGVRVTVDSFPGESFEAVVVRIADQAEFTPRNVQTEEGRRTTVYAIELVVANPDSRLKPGMPADVQFR
jgi:multidrug efflux pump subunit AcrA (membrane-fusion protein)